MQEYSILYAEINVISFLLMAVILSKNMGLSKMVAQRHFSMAIASEMLFVLTDTVFVLINEGTISLGIHTPSARIILRTVYYFATVLMCYYWFMYFEYMSESIFVKTKLLSRFSSVFVCALSALLILIFSREYFSTWTETVISTGALTISSRMPYPTYMSYWPLFTRSSGLSEAVM